MCPRGEAQKALNRSADCNTEAGMPCGHLGSLGFGRWNRFLRLQLHPSFLNAPDFLHLGLACLPALCPCSHCIPWPSLLGPLKLRVSHCGPASGGQLRLSSQRSQATMWVWLGGFCALGRDPTLTATCLCPQPGQHLDTSMSISWGSSIGAWAHSPRADSPPCLQTGGREVR